MFSDPSCKDSKKSLSFLVNLEYDPAQATAFPLCISLTNDTMTSGVNKTFDRTDLKRKKNHVQMAYEHFQSLKNASLSVFHPSGEFCFWQADIQPGDETQLLYT